MSIYHRLDTLVGLGGRPELCNVHVVVDEAPIHRDIGGGRWYVRVRSQSGSSKAIIAVHENPAASGLALPYDSTSRELLDLFENESLRAMLMPGEPVLVQAVPKMGEFREDPTLFLNVSSILLLRPHQLFGRRLIDFASRCPRRTFLAVAKGVGRNRVTVRNSGSVGGQISHDWVSAYALNRTSAFDQDGVHLVDALSDDTLMALVWMGLTSDTDFSIAVARGNKARLLATEKSIVDNLLARDQGWTVESTCLNNGVSASPDLLGTRSVVELKQVNPNSPHFRPEALLRQVEGYLAWAMVEYGVPQVCQNWKGFLLHLHEDVPDESRIVQLDPKPEMIGWRMINRHKLLGVVNGKWLPAPNEDECEYCSFAVKSSDEPHLPAACTYYCQVERSWNCIDEDRECPLLGQCDQHDKFEPYERIDLFNQLRRDLLEEEAEREAIASVLTDITADDSAVVADWTLVGFQVETCNGGRLRLKLPSDLLQYGFAEVGETFTVLIGDKTAGEARFVKRRGEFILLDDIEQHVICIEEGIEVSLRRTMDGRFPVRDQLSWLDHDQRRLEEPLSMRPGRPRNNELPLRQSESFASVPDDARLILVDVLDRSEAFAQAKEVITAASMHGQTLVIGGGALKLPEIYDLIPSQLRKRLSVSSGTFATAIRDEIAAIKEKTVWRIQPKNLYDQMIDGYVSNRGGFDNVVIIDAESLHLLALKRCIEAARSKVVLIGRSMALGPRAESPLARDSLLFQNTMRFLMEAGSVVLPDDIGRVDVVRVPVARAPMGLTNFPGFRARVNESIDIHIHVVSRPTTTREQGWVTLAAAVGRSARPQRREIELELLPGQDVPVRQLKQLLKSINPDAVDNLSVDVEGRLDSSILGYAARVIRNATFNDDGDHMVRIRIPSGRFHFIQEHSIACTQEAEALVAMAIELPTPCVAVSPFTAQCLAIAQNAATSGVEFPVFTPDTLGIKPMRTRPTLLLSLAADNCESQIPYPLSDPGSILPMLSGPWETIEVFCSPEIAENHPVIRLLSEESLRDE